jgi:ATP-dependent DNA ligase
MRRRRRRPSELRGDPSRDRRGARRAPGILRFRPLHLDGRDTARLPLLERKALLEPIVAGIPGLQFNGHEVGDGELVRRHACQLGFEGIVSKTAAAPYTSGNRGLWRKAKCLSRQEFVVVGWTDPEGSRPNLGALLLGLLRGRRQTDLRGQSWDGHVPKGA